MGTMYQLWSIGPAPLTQTDLPEYRPVGFFKTPTAAIRHADKIGLLNGERIIVKVAVVEEE